MGAAEDHEDSQGYLGGESKAGDVDWIPWLVTQPHATQAKAAKKHFDALLHSASQPRHVSGNSCIHLCHFLEQCRKSESNVLKNFAFSSETCHDLFSFYVEWNEKNQHRSMRQILELLGSLLNTNPDKDAARNVKTQFLQRLISIMTHQASQPLLKPAFRVLESFLAKKVVTVNEVILVYEKFGPTNDFAMPSSVSRAASEMEMWDHFVMNVFEWMCFPDTSPVAGKVLIVLFRELKNASADEISSTALKDTVLWQRWISMGLRMYPETLENVKNYLFPPLFKSDRRGSIEFLRDLSKEKVDNSVNQDAEEGALLLLSAMEVGKKFGLVDDPDVYLWNEIPIKPREFVPLPASDLSLLLTHRSNTIRSAAFSVLVSSLSSTKPFPLESLDALQENLDILHADTDAKFRNEVLSNSKHMIERLRGATSFLTKELNQNRPANAKVSKFVADKLEVDVVNGLSRLRSVQKFHSTSRNSRQHISYILEKHKRFLEWYIQFLTLELIPTASYQRHISALNCLLVLLRSGIQSHIRRDSLPLSKNPTNASWPFSLPVFTWSLSRLLLDLIVNAYEDVRIMATGIMKLAPLCYIAGQARHKTLGNHSWKSITPETIDDTEIFEQLQRFMDATEDAAMNTGRADLADGAALAKDLWFGLLTDEGKKLQFIQVLVRDLSDQVTMAETDFSNAVKSSPLHVTLAALSKVWTAYESNGPVHIEEHSHTETLAVQLAAELQETMMRCCERIWMAVRHLLCSDALDAFSGDEAEIGSEELLNYAFRAVQESSILVQSMLGKKELIPDFVLQNVGQLSFDQLVQLRHRGCISIVSTTFSKCCQSISDTAMKEDGDQLRGWYEGAVNRIYTQESATRRSAGIPAIITGILSSNSKMVPLREVMQKLQQIAKESITAVDEEHTNISQVHALNCLREIFKNSLLKRASEVYIADCFELAATSLRSSLWAVRNAAQLLFRSLIDALLGTSDADSGWNEQSSVKISYERYPTLGKLLTDLLAATLGNETDRLDSGGLQASFTVVELFRRAGPPAEFKPAIFESLFSHLESPAWDVRELAARVIVAVFGTTDWLPRVSELLKEHATCTANHLQGTLSCVKMGLDGCLKSKNLQNTFVDIVALTTQLKLLRKSRTYSMSGPIVQAAFEDAWASILEIWWSPECPSELKKSLNTLLGSDSFERACVLLCEEDDGSLALMKKSLALEAVSVAFEQGSPGLLHQLLQIAVKKDPDIALLMLQKISLKWDISRGSEASLLTFTDLYLPAYNGLTSIDLAVDAVLGLSEILNGFMRIRTVLPESLRDFCNLTCDPLDPDLCPDLKKRLNGTLAGNPMLSNAMLRLRGSVVRQRCLEYQRYSWENLVDDSKAFSDWVSTVGRSVRMWSGMLASHINAERNVDDRMAAVQSLRNFFCFVDEDFYNGPVRAELAEPLIILGDILIDDDDDIRQEAANVVSYILDLEQSIVPLAARKKLLPWLLSQFGDTKVFQNALMRRVMLNNSGGSITEELFSSMEDGGVLFTIESPNLFTDEVREACAWVSLLSNEAARGEVWDDLVRVLATWSIEGLKEIESFWEMPDGPFGWTANSHAFSIVMRLLVTACTLEKRQAARGLPIELHDEADLPNDLAELRVSMVRLLSVGEQTNVHGILIDVLQSGLQEYGHIISGHFDANYF